MALKRGSGDLLLHLTIVTCFLGHLHLWHLDAQYTAYPASMLSSEAIAGAVEDEFAGTFLTSINHSSLL